MIKDTESIKEIEVSFYAFIYKMAIDTSDGAYLDTSAGSCFSDFYADAASESFDAMVSVLLEDVEVRDAYSEIDLIKNPALNYNFVPRF